MTIQESLDAILTSKPVFGEVFYEVFFTDYPEVKRYFAEVDMRRQSLVVTMALMVIARLAEKEYAATLAYLRHLGTRHYDRAIPRETYPRWRDAMLSAMQRFHGDDWSEELSQQWTEAIDRAAEVMLEGYEHRYQM